MPVFHYETRPFEDMAFSVKIGYTVLLEHAIEQILLTLNLRGKANADQNSGRFTGKRNPGE
jgi:hypothetical protein